MDFPMSSLYKVLIVNEINEYYYNYDEESRLKKDNMHRVEYDTTIFYLNKIIKRGSKILDVGAGTGAYSFYYSSNNNYVTALDVSEKNVQIMKDKCKNQNKQDNLTIRLGDARNLINIADNSFDYVLCMGPMYHIKGKDDRLKCINECLRVLKPHGILAISYINKYASIIYKILTGAESIGESKILNTLENDFTYNDGCFVLTEPAEIQSMLSKLNVEVINNIGTDGIGYIMANILNSATQEEYKKWLRYHISTCEKEILSGYSLHNLCICKKM